MGTFFAIPKSALKGWTLQVLLVLSIIKVCFSSPIMLAWESNSDFGSSIPLSFSIDDIIALTRCLFGVSSSFGNLSSQLEFLKYSVIWQIY